MGAHRLAILEPIQADAPDPGETAFSEQRTYIESQSEFFTVHQFFEGLKDAMTLSLRWYEIEESDRRIDRPCSVWPAVRRPLISFFEPPPTATATAHCSLGSEVCGLSLFYRNETRTPPDH